MKLRAIQNLIRNKHFSITDHAFLEAFKDGVDLGDILDVILTGKVIERYPTRNRVLVFGKTKKKQQLHVVVDYSDSEPVIVTVYVPNSQLWEKGKTRK